MDIFEDISKAFTDKSKEAVKKAMDVTEILRLKSQVSAERCKLNEAYAEIGRMYYDQASGVAEEPYEDAFAAATVAASRISVLEGQLDDLEGCRTCSECGSKINKDSLFCSQCGTSVSKPEPQPEKDEQDIFEPEEDITAEPETVDTECAECSECETASAEEVCDTKDCEVTEESESPEKISEELV